ncbi:hypothetical protein [Simplicispira piscis]
MEQNSPAKKPGNWYSGWRVLAVATVTVLSVKLIGILGTFVAGILFLWLQPKRGTGKAFVIAAVVGVLVAVVYSAAVLPQFTVQHAQQPKPGVQEDKSFSYEEAIGLPPPKR